MALIAYLMRLRLRQQLDPRRAKDFWGLLLGFAIALLYGLLIGLFLRTDALSKLPAGTLPALRLGVAGALVVLSVLRSFLPTYSPLRDWIHPFYPLTASRRFALRWSLDLVSAFVLGLLIFCGTVFLTSTRLGASGLVLLLLAVVGGNALRRLLLILTAQQRRYGLAALGGTGALLAGASLLWSASVAAGYEILWAAGVTLVLLLADFVVEERLPLLDYRDTSRASNDFASRSLVWSLLWHNQLARSSLLMEVGLKAVFLLYLGFKMSVQQTSMAAIVFLFTLYLSPLLLGTYLFNNTWGFYPRLWQLLSLSPGQGKAARQLLLRLWLPVLAVDGGMSLVFILWKHLPLLPSVGQYVVALAVVVGLSLYWSGQSPQPVTKVFRSGGNTSILAGFATIALVLLLALPTVSPWFYLVWPLALLLSGAAWRSGTRAFATQRGRIYQKLFK